MAFSDQVKLQKYQQAGGRCQCMRQVCGHLVRCATQLARPVENPALAVENLSRRLFGHTPAYAYPGFEFNHKQSQAAGGTDTLANCEFLCNNCHYNTRSYGTNITRSN